MNFFQVSKDFADKKKRVRYQLKAVNFGFDIKTPATACSAQILH